MRLYITKSCRYCEKPYITRFQDRIFCSPRCSGIVSSLIKLGRFPRKKMKEKHLHKYVKSQHGFRRGLDGKKTSVPYFVYRCILEDCSHFISEDLVLYKTAKCFYCDKPYKITPAMRQLVKPHCGICKIEDDRLDKVNLKDILGVKNG